MIAIVDYGMGNVQSVHNAFSMIGEDAEITADASHIVEASHVVLPGVGAFGDAMANLRERQLIEPLRVAVFERRRPFLGICLGMQLLARDSAEHGQHEGLGWLDATVERFDIDQSDRKLKVPHMGWNDVQWSRPHPVFAGLKPHEGVFYFVHSFHMRCNRASDVVGTASHGGEFVAAVAHDNIAATQFHPEKSQDSGLHLLQNFVAWQP
jgi:imidazole glycerol-phosphate synthase subunit HisH